MPSSPAPRRLWLHLLLFLITFAGMTLLFSDLFSSARDGVICAAALVSILIAHESGHYLAARHHGVPASIPYFIVLGAVIRIRGTFPDRRVLFDIGAAGPLAGLVVALPLVAAGVYFSPVVAISSLPADTVSLGNPLVVQGLYWLIKGPLPAASTLSWHPLLLAGWTGVFVTALNLLPVGQFDGGHIAYALVGPRQAKTLGRLALAWLAVCVVFYFAGWAMSLIMMASLKLDHPAPRDVSRRLDGPRAVLAIGTLLLGLLCFLPAPLEGIDLISLLRAGSQHLGAPPDTF